MKTHYAYKYPTCFEFVWNFTKIGKKFEPQKERTTCSEKKLMMTSLISMRRHTTCLGNSTD